MPLLLAILALLVLAAPASAGQQVDAAVAGLRSDPVYVAPDARNILDAAGADRVRRAIRDAGNGPVYVAVLPASARDEAGGSTGQLVSEIHAGLGENGAYAVVAGNQFRAGATDFHAAGIADKAIKDHPSDVPGTLVAFVEGVGAERSGGGDSGGGGGGGGGGSGGSAGLIVLGVLAVGGGAFAVSRSRRRRREDAARMEELKRFARDDLVDLGDDVRAIDLDIEMPNADPRAREFLGTALADYEQAENGLDRARRPEDLAPVTKALEEGRWAMQSAKALLAGQKPPERRAPCFFDPRHGPSTRDVEWAPDGGAPRPVPACEADAVRVESGQPPMTREVELGGQRMPYWNAPAYYGPWAGGYFGGFGLGGGLLPGLLVGTALGSLMSPGMAYGWGDGGWGDGDGGGDGGDFGGGGGGDFGGGGGLGDFGGGDFGGGGDF
jgi:hypothetical protein